MDRANGSYGAAPLFIRDRFTIQTTYVPNYVAPPAPPPESLAYYSNSFDTYCREFTRRTSASDDNEILERRGTVCLQPDGMWHVIRYE